ncbi:hypothetical protein ACUN0C_02845 [Faunimonas sp. B44]|uniref:hypothetical protein n=1 Tax=Faunimonas sp. B44 TaxID=3461493 RepID=UPI004043B735
MIAPLGAGAVDLLLALAELARPRLSGEMLAVHHAETGRSLIEAGLIAPDGYEAVVTALDDHSDAPVGELQPDGCGGYRYFSGSSGWITVPALPAICCAASSTRS